MLKCRDVAEHGSHFIEGKIPWHQRPGWYLHLFLCGNCRRFVRHLRSTVTVLARLPRQQTPPETVGTIMATVKQHASDRECSDHRHD